MTRTFLRLPSSAKFGALLWIASTQYYVVQIVLSLAWSSIPEFSWTQNTISDLGNTVCDMYGSRFVCSPAPIVMNYSFIVLGYTMIAGAYLLIQKLKMDRVTRIGFICMALAGSGTILVGLFPENTVAVLHVVGAALPFIFGNVGMFMIGISLRAVPRWLSVYTIVSGIIGIIALLLFVLKLYLGIGIGGMERLVAYPQSIWMIVFGSWLLYCIKRAR